MEKRTVVKRIELGEDGGPVHIVLSKQLVEPCEITKQDADGKDYTEMGERYLVDEPHRVALYPLDPGRPVADQTTIDEQIAGASASLAKLGYPPIPQSGIDKIKRLLAAM